MENNRFKVNHQGPGWDHFKARDVYKKNILNNQKNEKGTTENKEKKKFSWLMDTIIHFKPYTNGKFYKKCYY